MASDLHGKKSIPVERLLTPLRVIFCVALISKELSFQTAQRIGQLEFFLCPFYSFMSGERGEGGGGGSDVCSMLSTPVVFHQGHPVSEDFSCTE